MGGICCKHVATKESPPPEKQRAPPEVSQGPNPILTDVTTSVPEEVKKAQPVDQERPSAPSGKNEGQPRAPVDLPSTSPQTLETAPPDNGQVTDPAQVIISETTTQAASSALRTTTVSGGPAPPEPPAPAPVAKPDEPAHTAIPVVDVVQVAPTAAAEPPVQTAGPSAAAETACEAPIPVASGAWPKLSVSALPAFTSEESKPFSGAMQRMEQARDSCAGHLNDQPKVKVETTRRNALPETGPDGSNSVSYSASQASSQQPFSSQAGGSAGPTVLPMIGSSAAPSSQTAGEAVAGAAQLNTAGAETSEGSVVPASDSTAGASTTKAGNAGFIFGAPRVKEHKEKKRKEPKRAKSHSSSSTISGAAPPTGSDTVTGSKASAATSGTDPTNTRTIAGSSSVAVPAAGSSAAGPSLGSTDMGASSSAAFRSLGGAGSSCMSPAADGSSGKPVDYKTVGRRIRTPAGVKGSTDGSSGRNSSRGRNSASTATGGGGSGLAEEAVPEVVPEEEAEGEATDHTASSDERSSSEHLSIMSPPEGSDVENVLQLICNIFQLPVALVAAYRSANIFIRSTALRLTDDDQWRYSLAQWSMLNVHELRDVLMVPDASKDERFKEYYCVKSKPQVRFFMASPLRSSTGELLGTLCMADFVERMLEPANLLVVNNLQTLVIKQLERDMSLAQERLENEVATEKLQQEMMRALDHFEKCIMFVDTSKPGWEVLYTNMAWEHVTGIPREHVMTRTQLVAGDPGRVPRVHVTGRPLQDFFMALGGAALDWSSTAAEVASRAEFTVHRVAVRQKPDKLVSLHLRLATAQATGELEGLLPKGLPSWVKARGNEEHNYFVFVEEVVPQAGGSSTVYEALAKHVEKVPGLELSHLLGKGGFGSVYYGTWNGLPVAVKMIDNRLTKTNTDGVSLEALMGQDLSHPNIVKTIKYVMRAGPNASSVSGSNSRGVSSNPRGAGPHSRHSGMAVVTSQHGSRNMVPSPRIGNGGSGGAPPVGHGGGLMVSTSNAHGMAPYMTSAQPGLSGMTSAQMAAALDLTSASGMQHLQRMGTTATSDATTVAGGGSSYSGPGGPAGDQSQGAAGAGAYVPPRVGNLIGSTPPTPQHIEAMTNATTSTHTSGLTAVGPASVQASSTSTAAGPPSIASGGGQPANMALSSDISRTQSANNLVNVAAATAPSHGASGNVHVAALAGVTGAARGAPHGTRLGGNGGSAHAVPDGTGRVAPVTLPAALPPLAVQAAGGAGSITAACPPGAPPPNMPATLTPEQQAAMTSRFSLAFSTITSGGDVLVPGKGSRSPSSSSGGAMTQPMAVGSAGSGEDMGEVWIIMEFCDRGSLQDALDRGALKLRKPGGEIGETHLPMMVATACEVASALQYLHGRGIVHGDLTAWNVMLCTAQGGQADRSGRTFVAKVADFGLSRTLDLRSKIKTRTYGTISHMPPECLISGIISKATDVFAFGVLLWQMYTGLRPWAGMNHGQIIYNVGMKNVQLLFPPGTPPAIADLSSSCTRTDPSQRPSFVEIMDKLDKIRASLGL